MLRHSTHTRRSSWLLFLAVCIGLSWTFTHLPVIAQESTSADQSEPSVAPTEPPVELPPTEPPPAPTEPPPTDPPPAPSEPPPTEPPPAPSEDPAPTETLVPIEPTIDPTAESTEQAMLVQSFDEESSGQIGSVLVTLNVEGLPLFTAVCLVSDGVRQQCELTDPSHQSTSDPVTYTFTNLAAGSWAVVLVNEYFFDLVLDTVTVAASETASLNFTLRSLAVEMVPLEPYPIETTVIIAGGYYVGLTYRFFNSRLGYLDLTPNETIVIDGVGAYLADEWGQRFSFTPAGSGITGEYTLEVMTSEGPGIIHIVFGDYYYWPGDGAIVDTRLFAPAFLNPVEHGTEACLIRTDVSAPDLCVPIPAQEPLVVPADRFGEEYLRWRVEITHVPDGSYDLLFRNIPRHPDVQQSLSDPIDVNNLIVHFFNSATILVEDLEPAGSVAVEVDPEALPAGSEVCLVNEETGEEICEPAPDSATEQRSGILAFRQAASTVTITFENVPPGTWHLILRVPGFLDLVIGPPISVVNNTETIVDPIPADIADRLAPEVTGKVTVVSHVCRTVTGNGPEITCRGRVRQMEGATVNYSITDADGNVVQTLSAPLARTGFVVKGQTTGNPIPGGAYTVCQLPLSGIVSHGPACVEIVVGEAGAKVTFFSRPASPSRALAPPLVAHAFGVSNVRVTHRWDGPWKAA